MAASTGLTKSQRRRANQRRQKQATKLFEETMGPMPEHIKQWFASGEGNLLPIPPEQLEPFERAPSHMVEQDEWYVGLNREKLAELSAQAGASRTDERDQRCGELRLQYPKHWCKRGGAGRIARAETKAGNPISERTVKRYFDLTKK
jgi:hypothetical protein